jgi:RNA polymerase primary sigma factor
MIFSPKSKEIIDAIFSYYKVNGNITEKVVLEHCRAKNIPILEINKICEYVFANGVYLSNEDLNDDLIKDFTHSDYNAIFNEILTIAPCLKYFINYISKIKAPQKKEYVTLLPQIKDGNLHARNRFFEMYLRIVLKMSLQYHKKFGFPLEDTIQEGCIGLIMALDKYEYDRADKFSTYAPWWIRQIIYRHIPLGNEMFCIPIHIKNNMFKISHLFINKSKASKILYYDNTKNICSMLSCTEQKALEYISLFKTALTIDDVINELIVYDDSTIRLIEDDLKRQMDNVLSTLPLREQEIIKMRYGIGIERSLTLEEIGEIFELTRERIRQIEDRAIARLKNPKRSRKLVAYLM